jgi:hypothetical protein
MDIGRRAPINGRERQAIAGIDDLNGLPVHGRLPLAVNKNSGHATSPENLPKI